MSVWTEYTQQTPKGTAGSLFDLTVHTVDSFRNSEKDGVLLPGMGVVKGENPGIDIALPTAGKTIEDFIGIVMFGGTNELDMKNNLVIPENYQVSVMRYGRVWVKMAAEQSPKYGDPVHLVIQGEKDVGCFKTAADEGNTIQINARIIEVSSNDLVAIELYNQMNATASASVDLSGYQKKITATGILKGDGQGTISTASEGTDFTKVKRLNDLEDVEISSEQDNDTLKYKSGTWKNDPGSEAV